MNELPLNDWPDVDILLATYNGERYLEEFLNSLTSQAFVKLHLIVGDDCSTDSTVEILNRYSSHFESFKLIVNPQNLGPAGNFINLLQYSQHRFICFADQDDVWQRTKLHVSVDQISDLMSPALFMSAISIVPFKSRTPKLHRYPFNLLLNQNQGSTFLFNGELRDLFMGIDATKIIMHDWALQILAQHTGVIRMCDLELVAYRIHESNYFGISTPMGRLRKLFSLKMVAHRVRMTNMQSREILRLLDGNSKITLSFPTLEKFVQVTDCFDSRKLELSRKFLFIGFLLRSLLAYPKHIAKHDPSRN